MITKIVEIKTNHIKLKYLSNLRSSPWLLDDNSGALWAHSTLDSIGELVDALHHVLLGLKSEGDFFGASLADDFLSSSKHFCLKVL